MRSFLVGSFALLLGLGACAHQSGSPLRRRAGFDLQCNQSEVKMFRLSARTVGVRGCNRQATYVQSCRGEGLMEECMWVLNGAVAPVAP